MAATFLKIKYTPNTQSSLEKKIDDSVNYMTTFGEMFFVVGRTNTGGRYYSETVDNWDLANKFYREYCDIVSYFGGGTVELYCITEDGYDIVSSQVV